MPAMFLLVLQLSLLEARLRLIRATLTSCLSRLPLHRFPLCRERLLCLGAHRGPFKGFRCLASAPLGVLRGLVASVGSWPKNESFAHLLTTNRRISSLDGSAPKTMRATRWRLSAPTSAPRSLSTPAQTSWVWRSRDSSGGGASCPKNKCKRRALLAAQLARSARLFLTRCMAERAQVTRAPFLPARPRQGFLGRRRSPGRRCSSLCP